MEYTKEIIEGLANENVTDIEVGIGYSNRVRFTLENGYNIIADIVKIQSPEERLEEIENEIVRKQDELSKLESDKMSVAFSLEMMARNETTETL